MPPLAARSTILHDARVASVVLRHGGVLELDLAHVDVYVQKSAGVFAVWSYRARLIGIGTSIVVVKGTLAADAKLVDGTTVGDSAQSIMFEFDDGETRSRPVAGGVYLSFDDGTNMRVESESLQVELLEELEFLDTFEE